MMPPHRQPGGGFRNPWPGDRELTFSDFLRWRREARAAPARQRATRLPGIVPSSYVASRARPDMLGATWMGHATCLLQIGSLNVLTDPMWSRRASPVSWIGPARMVAPPVALSALPPIDMILISHDHYDHLDRPTVRALTRLHPAAVWIAPLAVGRRLQAWGVADARELDWWDSQRIGDATITCTPARHFSGRMLWGRSRSLWAGWVIAAHGWRVYFAGDTAIHPEFSEISRQAGPFDLALLPVGAYEPRWLMESVHMNPEDAVQAYRGLMLPHPGAPGPILLPIHWGTFRLTDEPLDEPPERLRAAWHSAGLPSSRLWLLSHGQTRHRGRAG